MIKVVFFDLDGTLLPMERKAFEKAYFHMIGSYFKDYPNRDLIVKVVMESVELMICNGSDLTNEQVFKRHFSQYISDKSFEEYEQLFNQMYIDAFPALKQQCGYDPKAKELVEFVKSKGVEVVLATNPLFPLVCTKQRLEWAGFELNDFALVTTYENSSSAKPNPRYFELLLKQFNVAPHEVLLVGNDAVEDGSALKLGIKVALVDGNLDNEQAITQDMVVGNFDEIKAYLSKELG